MPQDFIPPQDEDGGGAGTPPEDAPPINDRDEDLIDQGGGDESGGSTNPSDPTDPTNPPATDPTDPTNPPRINDPTGDQQQLREYTPRNFGGVGGTINLRKPDVDGMYQAEDVDLPETGRSADFVPWEVTREQTVQGQLSDIYDRDSAFFQLAAERGVRRHLAGGGQNSAMAAQAGEIAAMDKAFEVAVRDAATYARSAEFNAGMQNQFSLAEQRFIHNALLSDQNYGQAIQMEKMRIDAQFESIAMDYAGRGQLAAMEINGRLKLAAQQHEYALDMLWEQEAAFEGREQRGFGRTMTLNGMIQMSNFYTNGVQSVMDYASNPNFTPAQARGALEQGLRSLGGQFDYLQAFWGGWAAGGPPDSIGPPGFSNWWDFSNAPGQEGQQGGGG